MTTEADVNNLLEALADVREKLSCRDLIRVKLTEADRQVLSSLNRLHHISELKFSDEDYELDAMLKATECLLGEVISKKDMQSETKEKSG